MEICSGQTDPPCACRASVLITGTPQRVIDAIDLCGLKKATDRGISDPTLEKLYSRKCNIQLTARNRHTSAFKHLQRIKNAFAPLLMWFFFPFFSWQPSLWWWAPIAACSLKAAAALRNYKLYLLQTHAVVFFSRPLPHIWLRFLGQPDGWTGCF